MRKRYWVLLAGSLGSFAGCSEFVSTGERTTASDVVGEPSDPTTESLGKADILGSALPMPDDAESVTDSTAEPLQPKPFPDEPGTPADSTDEPDVNSGDRIAKPVSLKKEKAGSGSAE